MCQRLGRLVGGQDRLQVVGVTGGYGQTADHGMPTSPIDVSDVGESGERVEADDPAVHVEWLIQGTQRGEHAQLPTPPNAELHDHTWHVQDHSIERVHGQQVGQLPAAQVQAEVVG